MERKPDESFAAYKERRAAANLAVKMINHESKGGTTSARADARRFRSGKHAGAYGKILASHFAKQRATPALMATHRQHIERAAYRKASRAMHSFGAALTMFAAA